MESRAETLHRLPDFIICLDCSQLPFIFHSFRNFHNLSNLICFTHCWYYDLKFVYYVFIWSASQRKQQSGNKMEKFAAMLYASSVYECLHAAPRRDERYN